VLRLVAAGASNAEIARDRTVEIGTVKTHLQHISGKPAVHRRTSGVARARERGLLD
jgi:ATP/maltotriose-dependent transcriptional regulator MalT